MDGMNKDVCECEATQSLPGCLPCHSPTGNPAIFLTQIWEIFLTQIWERILSRLQLSPGAFTCTSGPWPPCLEGRRDDPLDPVPVIVLHNVNNIILLPSNTPNGIRFWLSTLSSVCQGRPFIKYWLSTRKGTFCPFKRQMQRKRYSVFQRWQESWR